MERFIDGGIAYIGNGIEFGEGVHDVFADDFAALGRHLVVALGWQLLLTATSAEAGVLFGLEVSLTFDRVYIISASKIT